MAAKEGGEALAPKENGEPVVNGVHDKKGIAENGNIEYDFQVEDRYRLATAFYKDKEGKALQLTYQDKLKLVALTKQAALGKYQPNASPSVGLLDVVGNDRRQAWQALGDMPKEKAMEEFAQLLGSLCPPFTAYLEAHRAKRIEQERKRLEEDEKKIQEEAARKAEEETKKQQEEQRQKQLQHEMQIRAALNQQTVMQFRQYAEQQCPGQSEQQQVLIQQLQEQHYQQYMQQVYQQQLLHQQQQQLGNTNMSPGHAAVVAATGNQQPAVNVQSLQNNVDAAKLSLLQNSSEEPDLNENDLPPIAAASMWTRKDIKEFKDLIRKDPESVIKVGSGETVTVRVPTHEDGTCLFWEFATDSHDLGFGVYFEWSAAESNQVSVHVSESSDEEEEELDGEEGFTENKSDDLERGSTASRNKKDDRPPTDEIIPVYRRDCHEEVYCGSHMYPGRGVYLLKFDNSYSLWRSKTLYYRVYYTR